MDNMVLNLISPSIMVLCYVAGVIIKKCITKIDNKYIPIINALFGVILAAIMAGNISVDSIAQGIVSGWASTGLFESIRNIRGDKGNE